MFLDGDFYPTKRSVLSMCPDAAVVVRVTGGWRVFMSYADYKTWRAQR